MKVNRPEIISLISKIQKQEQARGKGRVNSAGEVSAKDRLEISAASSALKKELARLEEMNTTRAERLAELARQIEAGEYRVDPDELADIILRSIEEGRRL